MTMTRYYDGYGRRDPVPECLDPSDIIDCPVCEGQECVLDVNGDGIDCPRCNARGWLSTAIPTKLDIDKVLHVQCPCCEGGGEHAFGAGMDADSTYCEYCESWGYLIAHAPGEELTMTDALRQVRQNFRNWSNRDIFAEARRIMKYDLFSVRKR